MVSESTNLDSIEHDRELVLLARAKPQEGFIAQGPMVRAGSPRSDCLGSFWRIGDFQVSPSMRWCDSPCQQNVDSAPRDRDKAVRASSAPAWAPLLSIARAWDRETWSELGWGWELLRNQ